MHSKKQRVISFLMAFLLIFTFVFINPLTVQKVEAFAFAPALTQGVARVITGVLVSAGFIIHEGTTPQIDYSYALMDLSRVIYQTLDSTQKILLNALSIIDNVVEVPLSLYNSIVNKAETVINGDLVLPSDMTIKYATLKQDSVSAGSVPYPEITFPFYETSENLGTTSAVYTERKFDLRETQPYFIYEGNGTTDNFFVEEGIKYFFLNNFGDTYDIATYNTSVNNNIFLTPDLGPYNLVYGVEPYNYTQLFEGDSYNNLSFSGVRKSGSIYYRHLFQLKKSDYLVNNLILYAYFIYSSTSNYYYTVLDIYDKATNSFVNQHIFWHVNDALHPYFVDSTTNAIDYDLTLTPEVDSAPAIPNANSSANVITLPTELSSTIGATSTDVNVPTTDVPDTPNTETMDRIDSNVGELVTGGTLGEEVNTNIGTLEGLHGELTDKADFAGLMDILAEYINFMDISAISWLTTAIPLVITPFVPFISLGIILFFIDRVLNGGA